MVPTWYRCRKCRTYLFSDNHLVTAPPQTLLHGHDGEDVDDCENNVDGVHTESAPSRRILDYDLSCYTNTLYFLSLEDCPAWIKKLVEEGQFLRGKLNCPRCNGRVGSFDFIHKHTCDCGHHTLHPVHVVKSKIDETTNQVPYELRTPDTADLRRRISQMTESSEGINLQDNTSTSTVIEQTRIPVTNHSGGHIESACNENPTNFPMSLSKNVQPDNTNDQALIEESELLIIPDIADLVHNAERSNKNNFVVLTTDDINTKPDCIEPDMQESPNDEFTCPICLDVYYHPYTCRPCKHNFCGPCLRRLSAANSSSTRCPLCRNVIGVCLPNYELTKEVKRLFLKQWLARHKVERKVRHKLPSLPESGLVRGHRRNAVVLHQWAGVCFVVLCIMLCFCFFITALSFILWFLWEQSEDTILNMMTSSYNFCDNIWNFLIVLLIEGRICTDSSKTLIGSFDGLLRSFEQINAQSWTYDFVKTDKKGMLVGFGAGVVIFSIFVTAVFKIISRYRVR